MMTLGEWVWYQQLGVARVQAVLGSTGIVGWAENAKFLVSSPREMRVRSLGRVVLIIN